MFNSSLRQAARTCPNATLAGRNLPSTTSRSAATFTRGHQRRHSSSKPPVPPNDGSSSIPAASVKQVGAPRTTDKRPGAESRLSKRKGVKNEKTEPTKQAQEIKSNDWAANLPSVPSTQHLLPKDVYVAAFFSTHRPISITGTLPEAQMEDVEKIFQARPKKAKTKGGPAEVIYTLSNVVQTLDDHIQNPQRHEQAGEEKPDLLKALTQHNDVGRHPQHLDGLPQRAGNVRLVIEEIAKRFRPFNTPPAPVPAPEVDFQSKQVEAETDTYENLQAKQLEIEIEAQDVNPQSTSDPADALAIRSGSFFTSHTSPIEISQQTSQGGRTKRGMSVSPQRRRRNLIYQLISVKRQRKLKMKKHKYKKLMRKTRNLRRRQDKL